MFWGLTMQAGKRYTSVVEESFHLSQATLDLSGEPENTPVQVLLEYDGTVYVLCTLSKGAKIYQCPLDLNFRTGTKVSFMTIGTTSVHLTGYHFSDDDDEMNNPLLSDDEEEDDEVEEDDEEVETPSPPRGKRKKSGKNSVDSTTKKNKLKHGDEDSSEDEDEEESSEESFVDSTLAELDDDDDEEEDEDDESESESDADGDEAPGKSPTKKQQKEKLDVSNLSIKKSKNNASPDKPKLNKSVNEKTPKNKNVKEVPKVSGSIVNGTPKFEKQKVKSPNQEQKTPKDVKTPKKEGKTPKQEAKTPSVANEKRVLEGGVIAEELQIGEGPVARVGKTAQLLYVGKLKTNNKVFDKVLGGPGFKFQLGRGEVIKGWDVGILGMKVGGKRRLTIPSAMAYGAKGAPPVIPPNSTLVFDVELRAVN